MKAVWLRALFAAVAGLMLSSAGGRDVELMPREGRVPLFGNEAYLRLTPATDHDGRYFGHRPPLDRSGAFGWRVKWTGFAYDVYEWPETQYSSRNGQIVLRPIEGSRHLYVLQFRSDDPEQGNPTYEYALMWRLSAREYVGYLRLLGSECSALSPETLARIGFTAAEAQDCVPRDWRQVEALLSAYAATKPVALGTLRWLRRPDRSN